MTEQEVVIAPMRWWHLSAAHQLESVLFPRDQWTVEQFWSELAHDTRRYWVALDDDVVVGYAGLLVVPPTADVQTIAVDPRCQGKGVGRRLLGALLEEAQARACADVLLEVRASNASALALYQSAGFVQISARERYYPDGEDALILRRQLTVGAQ